MKPGRMYIASVTLTVLVGAVLGPAPGLASSQETAGLDTQDWRSIDPLSGVCNEALCRGFVELAKVMNGQTPDVTWLNQHKGTGDPLDMFNSGGSENQVVIARTALYYYEGAPHNSWLYKYYNVQLNSGYPYFLEDEIFSSVYTQGVVGATIAIRAEAARRGHTGLRAKASTFLRRYWAFLALGALPDAPGTWTAYNNHGTIQKPRGFWWGYNLALAGRRVYANGFGGSSDNVPGYGLQGVLLAMALQHPSRAVTQDLRISPAYWGGMRAAVEAVGYTLNSNGKVNLQSQSVPPYKFGLTSSQRALLKNFISDFGNAGVQNVLNLIGNQGVDHPISVMRTYEPGGLIYRRVTSWWGSGPEYNLPGDAKGGPWAIVEALTFGWCKVGGCTFTHDTSFVTRSNHQWGNIGRGSSWREHYGEIGGYWRSCAEGALPKFCMALGDSVPYWVVLRRSGPDCIHGCG